MKKQKGESQKKLNLTMKKPIKGVISACKCVSCGHHEMGIIKEFNDEQKRVVNNKAMK